VQVVAVSSLPPAQGIDDLVAALDAHRAGLDLPWVRTRSRRLGALADFVAEHGERGLRELGGRREARAWLEEQDPGLDEAALLLALERQRLRSAAPGRGGDADG
jgi:LAO/AO transport system kinase